MFTVIRLANDQTLENDMGQGAPPWTWPCKELAVDVLHNRLRVHHRCGGGRAREPSAGNGSRPGTAGASAA